MDNDSTGKLHLNNLILGFQGKGEQVQPPDNREKPRLSHDGILSADTRPVNIARSALARLEIRQPAVRFSPRKEHHYYERKTSSAVQEGGVCLSQVPAIVRTRQMVGRMADPLPQVRLSGHVD